MLQLCMKGFFFPLNDFLFLSIDRVGGSIFSLSQCEIEMLSLKQTDSFTFSLPIFLVSSESGHLKADRPMSFFEGLRLVIGFGPYVKLVMGFLFTSLAFMVRGA